MYQVFKENYGNYMTLEFHTNSEHISCQVWTVFNMTEKPRSGLWFQHIE